MLGKLWKAWKAWRVVDRWHREVLVDKPLLKSLTVWGGVLAATAPYLVQLLGVFGLEEYSPDALAGLEAIGAILVIAGRRKAGKAKAEAEHDRDTGVGSD